MGFHEPFSFCPVKILFSENCNVSQYLKACCPAVKWVCMELHKANQIAARSQYPEACGHKSVQKK